ncbi:MAG: TetR/AcrR family transcriptional regulator [Phormidesmis sp.]
MNRPAQSTQSNPAQSDKGRAILAGALAVFTTQGYAAASMDRIAKAAGVSKPTLYTYFNNKEGLFIALVQQKTKDNRQILERLPTAAYLQAPPETMLSQLASRVLEEFSNNHSLMTLFRLIIGESERFPTLAKTFVREVEKPMLEMLAAYLAAQPQLNFPDPPVAARIFVGAIVHYLLTQNIMQGSEILPMERDRMVKGLVHQMMAGSQL